MSAENEIGATTLIHALLAAHTHYGDAGDVDAMVDLYTDDATYELPNRVVLRGTGEMRHVLGGSSAQSATDGWGLEYMRHHLTTAHVELSSDQQASSDSYFLNVTNCGLDHWGRWRDTFARDDTGQWHFTSRTITVEGSVDGSWFTTASGLA